MAKDQPVSRPTKKSEYKIYFSSNSALKGWDSLKATRRNDLVAAWEYLTKTPLQDTPYAYQLKGELSQVIRNGISHDLRQLKLSQRDGARIWYYVVDQNVYLVEVHTSHPKQTM